MARSIELLIMTNTYKQLLADKQERLHQLTAELENILVEIPKLEAVVDALNALGVNPEPEPIAAPALDPDVIKAQELLAKAKGLRERVSEMKSEAKELNN